mgnify:CR=1 FL=1
MSMVPISATGVASQMPVTPHRCGNVTMQRTSSTNPRIIHCRKEAGRKKIEPVEQERERHDMCAIDRQLHDVRFGRTDECSDDFMPLSP